MAATANGIDALLVIAKQSAEGTKAAAGTGKIYPRITATFDTEADKYSSNEIDQSQQQGDTRLGNFRTAGMINGEASCGTYSTLIAALLRRDFTAGGTTTAQITVAATTGGLTRSAGSWLTDGFDAGNVVVITGFTAPATANNSRNFFVTSVTSTNLNGQFMDGTAMVAKTAGDSVGVTLAGKRTFTPLTGHTTDWFTAEVEDTKVSVNRCFIDQLVSKMDFAAQPNGMTTLNFSMMGKLEGPTTPSAYFTTPTVAPATGKFSGATALLSVNNIPSLICTGMSLSVDGQVKIDPVIGSKYAAAASRGKVMGSGQFTVLMQDSAYLDYFKAETEVSLAYAMADSNLALANTLAFSAGRIKITSAKVDDGEKNKIVTCSFDILRYKGTDLQYEQTTLSVQDSTL
ncbi:MAG TPA: phage tail tube protein [Rhodocyclaceae bacterium]|nr:phage tail tube protein [Rhodocyclaceae bacterium]